MQVETREEPGRRARKRDQTRHALATAAMQLFAAQGFPATTVEQVAERADVSPRTFFRYFDSKEDVLCPLDVHDAPIAEIVAQPSTASDVEAVGAAFMAVAPVLEPMAERLWLLRDALASSAALRGRDFDQRQLAEDQIAIALARRRALPEPDRRARLGATLGFAVVRRAMSGWLDLPAGTPLAEVLDDEIRLVATVVGWGQP